jgi:hypothetical protein
MSQVEDHVEDHDEVTPFYAFALDLGGLLVDAIGAFQEYAAELSRNNLDERPLRADALRLERSRQVIDDVVSEVRARTRSAAIRINQARFNAMKDRLGQLWHEFGALDREPAGLRDLDTRISRLRGMAAELMELQHATVYPGVAERFGGGSQGWP